MPGGETAERAAHWSRQAARREAVLLLLCVCSDVLPRTLLSGFLRVHSELWGAVVDNISHAGVAAASWSVVVSLSPPPPAAASFLFIALPGSPLRRCFSSQTPPPPPPTTAPKKMRNTSADGSRRDLDTVQSSATAATWQRIRATAAAATGWRRGLAKSASAAAVAEIVLAACVGSALDLDHFLAAGSLRLSRATGLAGRPWGHCVAALVVVALAMAALTRNARAGASVFTAGASHQLRDATRRGLWLYPPRGPKTPPLNYPIYLLAQVLLPLSAVLCLRCGALPVCGRSARAGTGWLRRWRWSYARRRSGRGFGPVARSGVESEDENGRALLPQ